MAQDEYYYEIQLTNKQLVFYFMAGASFLVLSFLAGIVVGRGVEGGVEPPVQHLAQAEDKLVTEEPPPGAPAVKGAAATAEDLNYSRRLESERLDDRLEKPGKGTGPNEPAPKGANAGAGRPPVSMPPIVVTPPPAAKKTEAAPRKAAEPAPVAVASGNGNFTIQVGAFKDRASADSVVSRLKGKGYSAFVVAPQGSAGGLFNVRVGSYVAREPAEKTSARLRDEEKFKPFIVKQ